MHLLQSHVDFQVNDVHHKAKRRGADANLLYRVVVDLKRKKTDDMPLAGGTSPYYSAGYNSVFLSIRGVTRLISKLE